MMLDKGKERYLFWGFQAVFFSVVFYSGMDFFRSFRRVSPHRCQSFKQPENSLEIFMRTLDPKHIDLEESTSSDISESYSTTTAK